MKRIVLAALLALAVAAPAAGANVNLPGAKQNVWHSNTFVSPSGNIHCRYFPSIQNGPILACSTANTGLTVAVAPYGKAISDYSNAIRTGGPVLRYGTYWIVGGFRCDSYSAGMQCRSSAGHGFVVNRAEWDTW